MNYDLEIAFDFKNSKEYYLKYMLEDYTDMNRIPKNLRNKKFCTFKKHVVPKPIGTFLLEFLNLDFFDPIHLDYFLVHYVLTNLITYRYSDFKRHFEFYKNRILTDEEINNPELILTEDELMEYSERIKLFCLEYIEPTQYIFRNIAENKFYKIAYENSSPADPDYYDLKKLKDNETYESALSYMNHVIKDIKMNFDINNFFLGNIPKDCQHINHYYSSNDIVCMLFITIQEFIKNIKNFKIEKCRNCDCYFIPKTAHKTLYCDEIYANGKTCKEYVSTLASNRTFEDDELCKKYRNRYKNLNKQASYGTSESIELYERYKKEGPVILENYKTGKITAEKFESWIDSMKIRKS